jgi:hypothetical protein
VDFEHELSQAYTFFEKSRNLSGIYTKVTQPLKAALRAMPTMFAPVLDIQKLRQI